ncbi:MAG TPA: protein kinase [Armatimonadota bacterium]|nr:protein kinase [Armatimonadota bacterium]
MLGTSLNNRYRLEAEIGHGGMGVVYRARDLSLNRPVAIKVLPPEFTLDEQFLFRFKNEVLNVARLDHPNIVQVYDVGQDGNTNYYVMQLVEGSDLHTEIVRRGRFSLEEAIGIIDQVASALDYAHQQGIIHRDIKPDNILIDRKGSPRVVDFGIAKTVEGTRMTGGMIGTPEYMSPEQARGEALDGRADQYALAIVVYEMLTGTTPFRSDTARAWSLVNAQINAQPPDPRQWVGELPEHVSGSLLQALAKVPGYRFATCAQFVTALAGHIQPSMTPPIQPMAVASTAYQPLSQVPPPPRFRSGIQRFLGALVGILTLGGGWLLFGQKLVGGANSQNRQSASGYSTPAPVPQPSAEATRQPGPVKSVSQKDPSPSDPVVQPQDESRWPWTSERLVKESDVQGMSKSDLELMRNEIYARYGWIFKRRDLQVYFDSQSWYRPAGPASQRDAINRSVTARMSALEKRNATTILDYEKTLGR